MVSTFHGLELGKRGLSVGQASLSTTGQNIANVNTKGYSRQQVNSSASPSLDVWTNQGANTGQLGTGVNIDSITRVRDRFLDQQVRDHSETLGQWQAKQTTLDRLETIVNEPSTSGLNSAMDALKNAWQDLANEPDSLAAQAIVKERAQGFVDVAQSMNKSMENLKGELTLQTQETVAEANGYLKQIAELNKSIVRDGNQSNDLKDKRDALVEDLSKLMSIKVDEKPSGSYSISLSSNKQALVTGEEVSKIDVDSVNANPKRYGGKLAGLSESMESAIYYQDKLISVVKNFAQANTMSKTGSTDQALFIGDADNFNISELKVNYAASPLKQPAATGKPSEDAQSYFRELVSELGAESQSAINSVANHEATLQATENRRQSVTGVSLDEEMANLIKYQHSYNAAARLVSMTDQMLDTIINRMAN
ncbi:Flagellar hook-associated protein FlgK [Planococcus halocryophilus Or1]|uniref:Flagellar hook-associated protein 1 n=1 Tax=Planococcus halocryophilus TaxID=1215089 RepID=A0A1C7DUD4_9BACL|nr:flagellar hook-associated protein FlgK [Planococcus halocryophilus]ANU14813.1 flagellar hook-associated protein FlgK [Planococcus halocryophilus]EMF45184.1 Flagellar hook-associated protein FlgK [Planococcus halocryophilus Or1]